MKDACIADEPTSLWGKSAQEASTMLSSPSFNVLTGRRYWSG